METLLQGLPNLQLRKKIRDDDMVDQLHHYVSVYLFAFAGFLIGIKELAGEPVDCWVNLSNWKHFQGHVNSYCWTHKMYKFPNKLDLSQTPYPLTAGLAGPENSTTLKNEEADFGEINFYRWVTIIFFAQAFMFKLPALIWSECNEYAGTQIEKMVSIIIESTFEPAEKRRSKFVILTHYLERWLKVNRKPNWWKMFAASKGVKKILRHCMLCVGSNTGNYLSSFYLVVKFLFLFNVLMQFVILTAFLDFSFWGYGPEAVSVLSADGHHSHFHRVGLCHFQLRGEGHWVQCMLSINVLLEKIFVIEWFWLLLLLIITFLNLIAWILRTLQTNLSFRFIKRYLFVDDESRPIDESRGIVMGFVVNYLGNDGIFVLRILTMNTNEVAMSEFISCLWNRYRDISGNRLYTHRDSDDITALEMDPMEAKNYV